MSDPSPTAAPVGVSDDHQTTMTSAPKDSSAQTVVALATVCGLVIVAISCVVLAVIDHSSAGAALIAVGAIAGAMANSLNAPTGISSVISSARKGAGQ